MVHNTHVAGIIAGNGFSSNGKYMGIAPDSNIVGVKVLDKEGGGSISDVISVGACNDRSTLSPRDCKVPDFSSRGPTPDGIHKPDILAPGVKINSLNNKDNGYHSLSGTSMAAPIIAGCAALLCENNPNISPAEIKETMTRHSLSLGYQPDIEGAGLLDIKKIVETTKPLPQPPKKETSGKMKSPAGIFAFDGWILVILIVVLILIL